MTCLIRPLLASLAFVRGCTVSEFSVSVRVGFWTFGFSEFQIFGYGSVRFLKFRVGYPCFRIPVQPLVLMVIVDSFGHKYLINFSLGYRTIEF